MVFKVLHAKLVNLLKLGFFTSPPKVSEIPKPSSSINTIKMYRHLLPDVILLARVLAYFQQAVFPVVVYMKTIQQRWRSGQSPVNN